MWPINKPCLGECRSLFATFQHTGLPSYTLVYTRLHERAGRRWSPPADSREYGILMKRRIFRIASIDFVSPGTGSIEHGESFGKKRIRKQG